MPPAFRAEPVRVRAPATSANLGPGFDAFGLALSWYDDVVVRVTTSGLRVDVAGEGADGPGAVARGEDNLVVRSLRAAFEVLGGQPPGLEVGCTNRIPHGRGLGSSAAAICAGLAAARSLDLSGAAAGTTGSLDDDAMLALATRIEGHPDNVAACLRGGCTVAWLDVGGPRVLRLDPAPALTPVAFVPAVPVSTATARGLLPSAVPHQDAAANAARAALLVEALTRRPDLLYAATADLLHQQYRAQAMPDSAALLDKLRSAGVPAVISGAGPTVLALVLKTESEDLAAGAGEGWSVHALPVDRTGVTTAELG